MPVEGSDALIQEYTAAHVRAPTLNVQIYGDWKSLRARRRHIICNLRR